MILHTGSFNVSGLSRTTKPHGIILSAFSEQTSLNQDTHRLSEISSRLDHMTTTTDHFWGLDVEWYLSSTKLRTKRPRQTRKPFLRTRLSFLLPCSLRGRTGWTDQETAPVLKYLNAPGLSKSIIRKLLFQIGPRMRSNLLSDVSSRKSMKFLPPQGGSTLAKCENFHDTLSGRSRWEMVYDSADHRPGTRSKSFFFFLGEILYSYPIAVQNFSFVWIAVLSLSLAWSYSSCVRFQQQLPLVGVGRKHFQARRYGKLRGNFVCSERRGVRRKSESSIFIPLNIAGF